jgi:hydrogenase nickel incorporation protein HypA/HybF
MHEMGIAQELVNIAQDAIPKDMENPEVSTIYLRIGKLAAVVEHSLRFCFEILTKDTALENAKFEIETIPIRARCKSCEHQWEVTGPIFQCPSCTDGEVEVLSGREIEIVSIELCE